MIYLTRDNLINGYIWWIWSPGVLFLGLWFVGNKSLDI